MKGLVVEKQAFCSIVLTPTGEYRKVYGIIKEEVGQEISIKYCSAASRLAAVAAALVIIIFFSQVLPVLLEWNQVYAYVTLDINPSVEFAIDSDYLVLKARPYNQEAESILTQLEYERKEIRSVLVEFTRSALTLQPIGSNTQNHVVVSFYSRHAKDEQSVEAGLAYIKEVQKEVLQFSGEEVDVDVIAVDEETHREAHKLGISAGRLKGAVQENTEDKNPQEGSPKGKNENSDDSGKAVKSESKKAESDKKESSSKTVQAEGSKTKKAETKKEKDNGQENRSEMNGYWKKIANRGLNETRERIQGKGNKQEKEKAWDKSIKQEKKKLFRNKNNKHAIKKKDVNSNGNKNKFNWNGRRNKLKNRINKK
ncbi:MAG TPA: hypothetical protein GX505_04020 [Clostridiales bacterium]|nr:hypothetical protein [Clostridiales bacterium]